MYNLLEYSSNYSDTTGSLWFHLKDEATNFNNDIRNNASFKFFMYKSRLVGETEAPHATNNDDGILKTAAIAVPIKYLSNFWRLLEMPLINCKVELKFK